MMVPGSNTTTRLLSKARGHLLYQIIQGMWWVGVHVHVHVAVSYSESVHVHVACQVHENACI